LATFSVTNDAPRSLTSLLLRIWVLPIMVTLAIMGCLLAFAAFSMSGGASYAAGAIDALRRYVKENP
jgi:hypothetical protein